MKHTIILLVIICNAFFIWADLPQDVFFMKVNENIIHIGDDFRIIKEILGDRKFEIVDNNYITLRVYDYCELVVFTSNSEELEANNRIYSLKILGSEYEVTNGIRIGDSKNSIEEILGQPKYDRSNTYYYYNNDFDKLELKFTFDNEKVSEIQISMGT